MQISHDRSSRFFQRATLTVLFLLIGAPLLAPSLSLANRDDKTSPMAPKGAEEPAVAEGDALTTNQGMRIDDSNNSLKAGPRGPLLLEDQHFREKITHFDHERMPERVVHARGSGGPWIFPSV